MGDGLNIERAINALITGSGVVAPLYHLGAPDNVKPPYITYRRISTNFEPTQLNISQLITAYVQVDIYDTNDIDLGTKAELVRRKLSGYRFDKGPEGEISACFPENDFQSFEWEEKLHRRTLMFRVMMREAAS